MNPTTLSNAEKLLMSAKWNGPLRNCNKSCNGYTDVSILLVTAIVDCCRVVDRWKPNVSVKPEPISDHEKKKKSTNITALPHQEQQQHHGPTKDHTQAILLLVNSQNNNSYRRTNYALSTSPSSPFQRLPAPLLSTCA